LQRVVAIARIPHEGIVPGTASEDVIASAADQHVIASAAGDGIVAGATVDREIDVTGRQGGRVDRIVAAKAIDHERVAAPAVNDHLRRQSVDDNQSAVHADADVIVVIVGVDGDEVGHPIIAV
jgi:hypothetical protein